MAGARERARLKKEEETLERIVRETDTMLKDQAEAKLRNRKEAVNERLATLQAQISQKEQRERREKEMERKVPPASVTPRSLTRHPGCVPALTWRSTWRDSSAILFFLNSMRHWCSHHEFTDNGNSTKWPLWDHS